MRRFTVRLGRWVFSLGLLPREDVAREEAGRAIDLQIDALLEATAAELGSSGRYVSVSRTRGVA